MTKTLIPNRMVEFADFDQVARDNLALEALRLAVAEGMTLDALSAGVIDTFGDQTGVEGDTVIDPGYTDDGESNPGVTSFDRNYAVQPEFVVDAMALYSNTAGNIFLRKSVS